MRSKYTEPPYSETGYVSEQFKWAACAGRNDECVQYDRRCLHMIPNKCCAIDSSLQILAVSCELEEMPR